MRRDSICGASGPVFACESDLPVVMGVTAGIEALEARLMRSFCRSSLFKTADRAERNPVTTVE
ncbi:MAG: hypothetical protein ACYCYP_12740 [Leptospirales bacterium]